MDINKSELFNQLLKIMTQLRQECPWDKEQTPDTLRNLTMEEFYELIAELDNKNIQGIKEELGDLLLHIVFYSKIFEEQNEFTIFEVIENLITKLIRRHPHIFESGAKKLHSSTEVKQKWESIKKSEGKKSIFSGLPKLLPALLKSWHIQKKAASLGFDWLDVKDVWLKVKEEQKEFENEIETLNQEKMAEEWGDWVFSIINLARFYKINPDQALEMTNQKFIKRFQYIENYCLNHNLIIENLSLEQLDKIWNLAKLT